MRRTFAIVLGSLLALSVLIAGVYKTNFWPSHDENGQASTTPSAAGRLSGVAIVDLDEVAKRLGTDVALDKEINNGQTSLNQQLRTLQTSLQEQYRQKEQSLKSQPAAAGQSLDSQKEQLSQLERELNLKLNDAKRSAQNELINYRQRLIQRFEMKSRRWLKRWPASADWASCSQKTTRSFWRSTTPTTLRRR